MDNNIPPVPAPVDPALQQPVPAPVPAPIYAPPPPMPAPAQPMAGGGQTSTGFFEGITLTDALVLIAVFTVFILMTRYFTIAIKHAKVTNKQIQRDVEEVKMNVQNALGDNYETFS